MTIPTAAEVLDREFLGIREKLLDIAASLDRIERAASPIADDPRLENIRRGLEILAAEGSDRAEQLQLIFSLPYDEKWQTEYQV